MAFLTGNPTLENMVIRGDAPARQEIKREALRKNRPAAGYDLKNARAHNYRGAMAGNKDITAIQAAYVNALARNKLHSKTSAGASSWLGKLFGG